MYALKAADFEELLGDMHVAFLEHAKSMYSQKIVKRIIAKEESTPLVRLRHGKLLWGGTDEQGH